VAGPQSDWQDGQLKVVVNQEDQYSIWPADRNPPPGWRETGKTGLKDECLAYIADLWRDMRPLSTRG
jgi:MbtH protein